MNHHLRPSIARLTARFAHLGIELPTGLAKAVADAEAALDRYQNRPARPLTVAVVDAVRAGTDPCTDPAVIAAVVDNAIAPLGTSVAVANLLDQGVADAAAKHADAVVERLRGPFDASAAQLVEAHAILDGTPLDDPGDVAAMKPEAAAAYVEARNVVLPALTAAIEAWEALHRLARSSDSRPIHRPELGWCAPSWPEWVAAGWSHPAAKPAPWDVVGDGHTLALATLDEHDQRIADQAAAVADAAAGNAAQLDGEQRARRGAPIVGRLGHNDVQVLA